jgi:hypothetical protein
MTRVIEIIYALPRGSRKKIIRLRDLLGLFIFSRKIMISNSKTIIVSVLCALGVISCTSDKPEEKPENAPKPIAQVQTMKLQKSEISETLSVYGTVLPWPDKLKTISVP